MKNLTNRLILGILLICPVAFSGCIGLAVATTAGAVAFGTYTFSQEIGITAKKAKGREVGDPEAAFAASFAAASERGYKLERSEFSEDGFRALWKTSPDGAKYLEIIVERYDAVRIDSALAANDPIEFRWFAERVEEIWDETSNRESLQAWGTANWGDPSAAPLSL